MLTIRYGCELREIMEKVFDADLTIGEVDDSNDIYNYILNDLISLEWKDHNIDLSDLYEAIEVYPDSYHGGDLFEGWVDWARDVFGKDAFKPYEGGFRWSYILPEGLCNKIDKYYHINHLDMEEDFDTFIDELTDSTVIEWMIDWYNISQDKYLVSYWPNGVMTINLSRLF